MSRLEDNLKYWYVVKNCLVQFHNKTESQAQVEIDEFIKRLNKPPKIDTEIVFHQEPYYTAHELVSDIHITCIADEHKKEYDGIVEASKLIDPHDLGKVTLTHRELLEITKGGVGTAPLFKFKKPEGKLGTIYDAVNETRSKLIDLDGKVAAIMGKEGVCADRLEAIHNHLRAINEEIYYENGRRNRQQND